MELKFKSKLSFAESLAMIDEVYNTVFETAPDTGVITYFPELYDYAYRLAIARYYGGYSHSGINETDYNVAMDIDVNSPGINSSQLAGIEKAISQKIEMKKAEMGKADIAVASKFDDIVEPIVNILKSLTVTIESIDINDLNKTLSTFNMENLMNHYLKSALAEDNRMKVIDEKNRIIKNLEKKCSDKDSSSKFDTVK